MPASFASASYSPDRLLAGEIPLKSRKATLLSGEASRLRGAVLGKKATAGTIAGAAAAGNTGDGTIGTLSVAGRAKEGVYVATFVEPTTNLGSFIVEDPDGINVGRGVVGTAFSGPVVFTISDGATDFVAGDRFLITVSAVTYKYLRSASAATDGSERPVAILAEDCDATSADAECLVYERGDFNESALNFGTGHTAATVRDALRLLGITLVAAQAA
ncbi:MAG: head decoration protein [Gemmatimonadaceae bacterium]